MSLWQLGEQHRLLVLSTLFFALGGRGLCERSARGAARIGGVDWGGGGWKVVERAVLDPGVWLTRQRHLFVSGLTDDSQVLPLLVFRDWGAVRSVLRVTGRRRAGDGKAGAWSLWARNWRSIGEAREALPGQIWEKNIGRTRFGVIIHHVTSNQVDIPMTKGPKAHFSGQDMSSQCYLLEAVKDISADDSSSPFGSSGPTFFGFSRGQNPGLLNFLHPSLATYSLAIIQIES